MKFDVIVGNPPFSKTNEGKTPGKFSVMLYTKFFKLALKNADIVAMIMPTTDTKVQKEHNELLRSHANEITYVDKNLFPNITMPMWYAICDKNNPDKVDNIHWALGGEPKNKIPWTKGNVSLTAFRDLTGGHGDLKKKFDSDITIYHKINSTGLIVKYGRKDSVKESQLFPSTGYALLLPQTFADSGWSNYEIVKCNGKQAAFNGMNIVFFDTKKEAERLVTYMQKSKFIKAANSVKQGFNNMNLTCLKSIDMSDYK